MKTTLEYNTIETFQKQPAWKKFLNVIVDTCKRHFDKNLLGYTESTNTLVKIDENTTLQPVYPTLSYKNDLMHLNMTENISIRGLMRILKLYGCKLLDIETNVTIPHTFKVQGKDRGGDLWGFHTTNRTYDYEANSITNVPELDNLEDTNTDYFFPAMSDNYFEEDKTFKYIYDIYGYNQKEPMLCYSSVYEIKTIRKIETPDSQALVGMQFYVLDEDVLDEEENMYKSKTKVYQKSGDLYYLSNFRIGNDENDFHNPPLASGEEPFDAIIAEPVFYIINDNDKVDLVDANDIVRYNSDDDDVKVYDNLRGISPNRTNDVFKITLTYTGVKLNDYKIYLINLFPNKYVVSNNVRLKMNSLNPYYAKEVIFGGDSLIRTQPVFTYHFKDKDEYIDTASYTYNDKNVKGGVDLPSYQFLSYPYKKTEEEDDDEVEKPILGMDFGNLYNKSIANEVGDGCVNNIEMRNAEGEPVSIDESTLREISSPDASFGAKYNTCVIYSVKKDSSDGEYKPCLMLGKYYYIGELSEGSEIFIFNENSVFDMSEGFGYKNVVKQAYKNNSYYIGYQILEDEEVVIDENNYILEDLRKQEYIETMYFNHFVKIYPITKNKSNTMVSTNLVYCDNLELLQYGNSIPYIVTYMRKGEKDEDEKFMDLDCSVFSRIMTYNKHTHLVTLNNEVCFPNSSEPIYAVVAYQHIFPFSMPESIKVLTPNNGVKDIVKPMVDELFGDRVKIDFYSQKEYDELEFWNKHNNNKIVNTNNVNTLLQELDNRAKKASSNYAIYGLLSQELEGNETITLEFKDGNNGEKTAQVNGYIFHFDKSDLIDEANSKYYYNYSYITIKGTGAKKITCIKISSDFKNLMSGGVNSATFSECTNLRVIAGYSPIRYVGNDGLPANLLYVNTSPYFETDKTYFNYYRGLGNIYNINLNNVDFLTNKIDFRFAFYNCENLETLSLNFKKKVYATNISGWLKGCKSLREVNLSNIDFSLCTDTSSAFEGCTHLERIIVNWGNNNVITDMNKMFKDCINLKSIGNFDGWYNDNVDLDSAFENCESLEEVILKNLKGNWATNVGLFKNCGAKTIGFYSTPYPSTNVVALDMPNLENIEFCNEVFDLHSDSTDIKVWIETPNLTRESFLRFIQKQFTASEDWVENGYNVYVNPNVIDRLILNTDIAPAIVDKDGIVICYNLLKHSTDKVKIYPTKDNIALGLSIKTNVAKKSPYQAGVESIDNLRLTITLVKRKYPIKSLFVYANDILITTFAENQIADGGTFTYDFDTITDTTEIKAVAADTMDIYVQSNKIKYSFNYPFYNGLIEVSGTAIENGRTIYYAEENDITEAKILALNTDYYQNRRIGYGMTTYKIPIFAFPKQLSPVGLKAVVDYNEGHNNEDVTDKWLVKELTINGVDYLAYHAVSNRIYGYYYFVIE